LPPNFNAVIPVPSFSEYEKAALRVGGKAVFVQLPEDFSLNNEQIKKAVNDDTKIMCICNPHSPSGTLYSKESILDLIEFCQKKGVIFSIDENYIEFAEKDIAQIRIIVLTRVDENLVAKLIQDLDYLTEPNHFGPRSKKCKDFHARIPCSIESPR